MCTPFMEGARERLNERIVEVKSGETHILKFQKKRRKNEVGIKSILIYQAKLISLLVLFYNSYARESVMFGYELIKIRTG